MTPYSYTSVACAAQPAFARRRGSVPSMKRLALLLTVVGCGRAPKPNELPLVPAPGAPYTVGGGTYGDLECFPLPAVERNNNPNIPSA